MASIAAIGEVMVELAPFPSSIPEHQNRSLFSQSFAGDTYNSAIYMARLGLETHYITKLGADSYSNTILSRLHQENINTQHIEQIAGRTPGLYIIHNLPDGEREFFYWRTEAPARQLFQTAEACSALFEQLKTLDCIYLSGITLAIIGAESRQRLGQLLKQLREAGVTIAFDSNYRPRLWQSQSEAQQAMLDIMQHTDIALLTLDDELMLWGDDSIEGCKTHYASCKLQELVLKRGAKDAVIITPDSQEHVPVPPVQGVVDTTGAGDSFNAGYLAARLQGKSATESAAQGIKTAGVIIRHRGAIIEKETFLAAMA